ncbi:cupin-like domain-containing protein [Melittangium boletus]|uniref:Cupin n=1 Tax=Melittangium boletus DSM 14713 TaxID=1294270 RepID=A0A250IRF4_9BACT|nr:cupin-like domain-containing protein [Melittangium boletus]ATB34314.1 cupin [Melittangium boletus DSM 14713]
MQSFVGDIERRDTFPSHEEFVREFMSVSRPVLFTRAMADWSAWSAWNLDWLERQHGSVLLKGKQLSVRDWIAKMKDALANGRIEYLSVPIEEIPGLAKDFSLPDYYRFELLRRTETWIGPAGTRTPLHCDYSENLFCQVIGRKRFQLYSPDAISALEPAIDYALYRDYVPEYIAHERNGRGDDLETILAHEPVKPRFDFVIEPGEVMYLPYGWFHRVSGLEFSWSISSRWVTPGMILRRLPSVVANTLKGEPARSVKKIREELTRSNAP